ncbi:hypothetical protein [Leptospira levettii]|uniref:hypothetical protein n=1 Tax=Leptospira levettii TaxID=2023178 RepID=UPI003EBC9537
MKIQNIFASILLMISLLQCSSLQEKLNQKAPNAVYLVHSTKKENWEKEKKTLPYFRLWNETICQPIIEMDGSYSCEKELSAVFEELVKNEILVKEDERVFRFSENGNASQIHEFLEPVNLFVQSSYANAYERMGQIAAKGNLWNLTKNRMDALVGKRREILKRSLETLITQNGEAKEEETVFKRNYHPYLLTSEDLQRVAKQFVTHFESMDLQCALDFKEPVGESFVSSGYDDPVVVKFICSGVSNVPIDVTITGNSSVRLSSSGSIETGVEAKTNLPFDVFIYSLSMNQSENVLQVKADFLQKEIRNLLKKDLGLSDVKKIEISPQTIPLSNTPTGFSPEYSRYAEENRRYSETVTLGSIQNGQFQSTMMSNGVFSFGGVRGQNSFDLIFGHPNGQYAEGIWSSFSKVKIGDQIYSLRDLESQTIEISDTRLEVLHKIESEKIWIYSFIEKEKDQSNSLLVGYRIENKGNQSKQVGILLFLDTWAGATDGVPFSLGFQTTNDRIITNEYKFNPTVSPFWETNDTAYSGQVFLQNKMVGLGLVPPDEISFVNWGSGYGMDWEYPVSDDRSVTGDSAVYLKWNPKEVAPNKTYQVKTLFSSIDRTKEVDLVLTDPLIGNGMVSLFKEYPSDVEVKLDLVSENGNVITPNGSNQTSFKTNKDSAKQLFQVPVVFNGVGKLKVKVVETVGTQRKEYPFEIQLPESDRISQPTLLQPQKKIPVQFYSKETNRKILAKLVDSSTLRVLDSKELSEKKDGTSSIYSGELQPPSDYQGQGVIQYVDLGKETVSPIRANTQEAVLNANQVEITFQNGSKKLGSLLSQNLEEITIESDGKQETFQKRSLSRIRFGR